MEILSPGSYGGNYASYDLALGCWGDGGVASSDSVSLSISDWTVTNIPSTPSVSSSTTNGDGEGAIFLCFLFPKK